jgi:hypothetical protein
MGKLTVALTDEIKWEIDPPYSDILGQTLFVLFPRSPTAFVFAHEFVSAAVPLLELRDDGALAAAVAELSGQDDSTMVTLEWERAFHQTYEPENVPWRGRL